MDAHACSKALALVFIDTGTVGLWLGGLGVVLGCIGAIAGCIGAIAGFRKRRP